MNIIRKNLNRILIKGIIFIILLLVFSPSLVFSQQVSSFGSPWELQAHLKYLNEHKLYSELRIFLEDNDSNLSLSPETRLYILDDLANLYTTKLVDFKKAEEYNKKAQAIYSSLVDKDLKEVPFSNYFNQTRLISDLFYLPAEVLQNQESLDETPQSNNFLDNKKLAERSDLVSEFSPEVISSVRREDLLSAGNRIKKRVFLLQKNLGIYTSTEKISSPLKSILIKNFELESPDKSIPDKDKNYILANYYWSSISPDTTSEDYLPIIQFGGKAIDHIKGNNPSELIQLCHLHYWMGISYLKTGQVVLGLSHLNEFDSTIEKLEGTIHKTYEDQKLFIDNIELEIKARLHQDQLSDKKWLEFWREAKSYGSAMLETMSQVAVYAAYSLIAYLNIQGGQPANSQELFELADSMLKLSSKVHESGTEHREKIEYEYQGEVVELLSKYIETEKNIEENFFLQKNSLTPKQFKYARFMGPNEQLDFFVVRGDGLSDSGNISEAKSFYLNALSLIEKQRATIDTDTKRIVFSGHRNSIYVKLIKIYSQENDAAQAFHLIERAKGRVFADLLESKNLQLVRNEENDFYQDYLLKNSEMNEILSHGTISLDQIKYLEENRGIQPSAKFKTTPLIEFNNLDQAKPISLEETKNILSLPSIDSDLIQYFVSNDKLIIVLAGATPQVTEISIPKDKLIEKVSRLRELISQGHQSQEAFMHLSQELYKILIQPVSSNLSKQRVIISAHGPLHYLPFQLLHSGNNYLLENHTLNYIPSATVLRYLSNKSPIGPIGVIPDRNAYLPGWAPDAREESPVSTTPKRILLMGNPELENDGLNLPYSEIEIENAATFFADSTKLMHNQASETNLKEKASSYDILHFATHATFDNADPFNSSLLLAEDWSNDGKLTVEEIYQLQLKPSLVVLSACETGLGQYSAGDEIIGFYRAFMYAGAKSIIATLWPIADEATSFLINHFYLALRTNSLGESLRIAQLKTKKKYPNPNNWGGFVLVGRN